jgi:hypothetical protein
MNAVVLIEQDYTISISSDDLPKGKYIMPYYSSNILRKIHRLDDDSM